MTAADTAAELGCRKILRVSCDPLGKDRELWGLPAAEPVLRLPEQGIGLWQTNRVNTNLCSANTEGGLLLQSKRQITYCACARTTIC